MISSFHSLSRPVRWLGTLASLTSLAGLSAFAATSVATVPVGYMKIDVPTGVVTPVGIPLEDTTAPLSGIRTGIIESAAGTTLTNAGGGWTSPLSSPSAPWLLRITSGAAAGKVYEIASNTATSITVSGGPYLSDIGLVAGVDTFELVPLDTLWTLLGSDTVQGGTSAATADNVQVRSGASWLAYFFDTNLGYWRRTLGPATNSNNVVVRPGSGLQILRRGAPLTLTFAGQVGATPFRVNVNNSSTTAIHTGFPVDTTLGALGVQHLLSGWRSGPSAAGSDLVALHNGTAWVNYFYNGVNWQPATGAAANSDAVAISGDDVITIQRPGATPGTSELIRAIPYSL
jgi:hypothetical protein